MAKEKRDSFIAKMFKPRTKKQNTFDNAITMVGYEPSFSKFGSQVLYSDIVLSAVKMKARFFGKLEPRHIRNKDGNITSVSDSSIAKVLRNPNHYQTTYDFLTQAYFMREKDDNCYIYADYYKNNAGQYVYTGLYVLLPSGKPQICEDPSGNLFYKFTFDGYSSEVEFNFNEVVCWKQNHEDNQYIGGGKFSRNAEADLLNSLNAYTEINQATSEAAKLGCMFDGILKVNAYAADDQKTKEIRDNFINDLRNGKGGIGVLDNGAEYEQVQRQLKMVDSATMTQLKENILIHTGVTISMLEGKFTPQEKEAFYESHIEPAAISLGQALSKMFFSQWQQSYGDQIVLYPHKVQLMATSEIVSIIQNTISAGVFKIDEYREMLGYAPLENGEGQQRPRGFNNLDGGGNKTISEKPTNDSDTTQQNDLDSNGGVSE